jgi:hypothetical protein
MDAPAHVACLSEVRLIGVISTEQIEDGKKGTSDPLHGVAIHSCGHEHLKRSMTEQDIAFATRRILCFLQQATRREVRERWRRRSWKSAEAV